MRKRGKRTNKDIVVQSGNGGDESFALKESSAKQLTLF